MTQTNLLELRKEIKERKPEFIRQDNPKRMKVNSKWRKPKGVHSKIRHAFKGRRKMPSPGYKSPVEVRGMHSSGMEMINVFSIKDLQSIDKRKQGIIVGKTVGKRKKLQIWKMAMEMKIQVLNVNAQDHITKIEQSMNKKQETKKKELVKHEKKEAKPAKEDEKSLPAHEHKDETKEITDDQRKESEKKEKDKVLIKKV